MPASVRARLFDPFRARDRHANGGGERGLGLGLYIAQQVVLAHGGRIELESGDAERTTFRLELPRHSKA
jgi:signal transduction histidine kinase